MRVLELESQPFLLLVYCWLSRIEPFWVTLPLPKRNPGQLGATASTGKNSKPAGRKTGFS